MQSRKSIPAFLFENLRMSAKLAIRTIPNQ